MAAPKGNQFWKQRSTHGRKPIFETAEALEAACYEYFQWIEDNPLMAAELVKFQGEAKISEVPYLDLSIKDKFILFYSISRFFSSKAVFSSSSFHSNQANTSASFPRNSALCLGNRL